ncbi:hypothetical protein EYB45_00550 [Erythrobacteraceae bacterium CFH 75059]|uniref:hypothetical protein n=1 Tax=Qipengyuania thermophila TaxID=2509361 RepID=UPI001020B441|nr:hypothetical protein [Qipengyuania thermophila]TCD06269.1 hypothetical protein EYB45_00550 [Erythrobacteraceae bacterium CFH 75059]
MIRLPAAPCLLAALPVAFVAQAQSPSAEQWEIGPVERGRSLSPGMPPTLEATRDGPAFRFPQPSAAAGHVHYVTVPVSSLERARRITLRYRIDAAPGVRFVPQEAPHEEASLSLYFQQRGDGWTRRFPTHRWYAPSSKVMPLRPGTHTVTVAMNEPWVAVLGGTSHDLPEDFAAARRDTARVGFVFGSAASGRGHGVFATGPARFTILDFRIE